MGNIRNQVRLIGNLGRDPEFREISSGRKMARFSLATNDYYYGDQGEKIAETQWHQLVAWGKLAEVSERLLHKGSELVVDGKLNTRSYTDKEGNRRSRPSSSCLLSRQRQGRQGRRSWAWRHRRC